MNVFRLLALIPAFFLTCCGTVTVKQIAGDRVPEKFSAELCKGSWRGPDGTVASFRVKDEARGIVEVRTVDADGDESTVRLALRTLGERVVATAWEKEQRDESVPAPFLRVAITPDHISFFLPNEEFLKDAVKKGRIAGEIRSRESPNGTNDPEKKGKAESVVLEKFGLAEAEKLGGAVNCFDADPATVLVREVAPRPEAKTGKSGKAKK